jgi:hypothetical protein
MAKKETPPPTNPKVRGDAKEIADLLGKKNYQSCWSSPEAFARYIGELKKEDAWNGSRWGASAWATDGEAQQFTGTKNMGEALRLAQGNWKEGAEKVERMRNRIAASRPMSPKATKYGITGAVPSIPRAVAGNILNMKTPESNISKRRPTITLISNMCVNWTVDQKTVCNRSAAVATIIDQVEAAGYSVEVISTALTTSGCFTAATSVLAKASHQPVDVIRLAFVLGHSSMFRRMVFADWETEPTCQSLGMGLGSARDRDAKGTKEWAEKSIYKVPSAEGYAKYFNTEEAAMTLGLDFLIHQLKEQGCPCFKNWQYSDEYKKVMIERKDPVRIFDDDDDWD